VVGMLGKDVALGEMLGVPRSEAPRSRVHATGRGPVRARHAGGGRCWNAFHRQLPARCTVVTTRGSTTGSTAPTGRLSRRDTHTCQERAAQVGSGACRVPSGNSSVGTRTHTRTHAHPVIPQPRAECKMQTRGCRAGCPQTTRNPTSRPCDNNTNAHGERTCGCAQGQAGERGEVVHPGVQGPLQSVPSHVHGLPADR